jgi:hypothetical protein
LQARLLAVPGVVEALVAHDEGVVYLKVDKHRLDWARLNTFAASA